MNLLIKTNIALLLLTCFIPLTRGQTDAPPAYPRDGAVRMLENERVIVWDISWLKQDYPVHRHRYDHAGVYYSPGDRLITSSTGEAREVQTPAWNISFQLAGVTHSESGISDAPLRAVFIQIKTPVTGAVVSNASLPRFPDDGPLDRRSNERVRVWEYNGGLLSVAAAGNSAHYHGHDAVVVWFDADNGPNVHFVSRGSVHDNDIPTAAQRVFVFEIL
ncbi:MAG: hypothetical protein R3F41_10110 [Gammaproteobacteria bacterium]|nr:hypothetical protein [Pseudomonadales bacterium]MCP5347957.1 hypothetical protein [Pseudomonadales bacterium]